MDACVFLPGALAKVRVIHRRVPVRTFADWNDAPPGFLEVDLVAQGGTIVKGCFIQTLVATDIATGWTECVLLRAGVSRFRAPAAPASKRGALQRLCQVKCERLLWSANNQINTIRFAHADQLRARRCRSKGVFVMQAPEDRFHENERTRR